jgi:transposase
VTSEIQIDVQDIDHLGIIAGIIDEIGIVEIIDKELGTHIQEKVSAGQVVKAMIINCMGFLTAPLYLFSEFFVGKATEHLIGKGIQAEYLNDSRLGRVLEQLYEYGVTILFVKIAYTMSKIFGLKIPSAHIDGTSLSVQGKYQEPEEEKIEQHLPGDLQHNSDFSDLRSVENSEPIPIKITHGYSRDHRPDLKQFTLNLLTTGEEGIPLFMQLGDGNKLDQNAFPEMIKDFKNQWIGEQPEVYVMDAAFYTEENLSNFQYSIKWISRVPFTLKAAQELTQILLPEQFTKSTLYEGYRLCQVCTEYARIKQLWVIVESDELKEADLKALSKRIEKSLSANIKSLKSLESQEFACEADALSAAKDFEKTLKYHLFPELKIVTKPHYKRKGRPKPNDEVTHYTYHIQANLIENEIIIKNQRNQAGRFILATNLLDEETKLMAENTTELELQKWTPDLILQEYKAQQSTERGFRFIKDPLFFVSRVFLKSTKRIMALAMIMTLALMVYSLGQRQLRQALESTNSTLPNQKGKPTARPTLRWILQCFQSVHLVFINGIKSSIKLTDRQNLILQFFGSYIHKYYFLS